MKSSDYRKLFDTIKQGFCVIEVSFDEHNKPYDYDFLEVNKVFEEQTGLIDPVGKSARQLVPNLEQHWFDFYGKIALTGKAQHFTNGSDAMGRWFNVQATKIGGKDSRQVAIIFTDVSSEKKMRSDLDATSRQLDSALSVGLVSTWTWNIAGDVVIGDKNLAKNFGISTAAALKGLPLKTFIDIIHEDDRQRVASAIQKAIADDSDYEEEFRVLDSKNNLRWVIARGQVQRDEQGEPINLLGILIDITDRKQAESKLHIVNEMFSALFDSTVLAIAMADTDGNVKKANKTFLKLFGYSQKELAHGLTSEQLSAPSSRQATQKLYSTLKQKGEAETVEKTYRRKDGSEFPALVGAAMLPSSNNTFMAFILDVSETARLKELNSAKDDFIAIASHQLRTPATAVKQYLGILSDGFMGELNQRQLECIGKAYKSNDRQLTIISDLLKTAQIDAKGYDLTLIPKNICKSIEQVIGLHQEMLQAKHQQVSVTSNKATVIASIDEVEFAICIANLLENASKYSADGSTIAIEIQAYKHSIKIVVRDSGVGIAEADVSKIFDKFTRVDNKFSDTVTGNGLGLYWVKRIVDLHNGTIDVESEVDKGTTFTITLPA